MGKGDNTEAKSTLSGTRNWPGRRKILFLKGRTGWKRRVEGGRGGKANLTLLKGEKLNKRNLKYSGFLF